MYQTVVWYNCSPISRRCFLANPKFLKFFLFLFPQRLKCISAYPQNTIFRRFCASPNLFMEGCVISPADGYSGSPVEEPRSTTRGRPSVESAHICANYRETCGWPLRGSIPNRFPIFDFRFGIWIEKLNFLDPRQKTKGAYPEDLRYAPRRELWQLFKSKFQTG